MTNPCEPTSNSCNVVWDWTSNETAALLADVVFGRAMVIIGLFLGGLILRWLIHKSIDRLVKRAEQGMLPTRLSNVTIGSTSLADAVGVLEGEYAERRVQRARAMGSLLKSIVTGTIMTLVVLVSLAELNLDITPLIASAGIAGVALGFGAQSLVKDFLAGLFMIFEDQYGVGDTVDLGEASGVVEAVSLRITRLRDVNGAVWYVRNGEILRVGNQSQNWARIPVDVAVSYTEDLLKVTRVLEDLAHEMWTDEDFDGLLIEQPEVMGVEQVVGDVVTIRVMLKTKALEQFAIARKFRERAKVRLEHEGVEVPSHLPWGAAPGGGPGGPPTR